MLYPILSVRNLLLLSVLSAYVYIRDFFNLDGESFACICNLCFSAIIEQSALTKANIHFEELFSCLYDLKISIREEILFYIELIFFK